MQSQLKMDESISTPIMDEGVKSSTDDTTSSGMVETLQLTLPGVIW